MSQPQEYFAPSSDKHAHISNTRRINPENPSTLGGSHGFVPDHDPAAISSTMITEFYGPPQPTSQPSRIFHDASPPRRTLASLSPIPPTDPAHRLNGQIRPMPPPPPKKVPPPLPSPGEVTPLENLNLHPTFIDCPWCHSRTHTRVKKQKGAAIDRLLDMRLWISAAVVMACGWRMDRRHECEGCGKVVALQAYDREGGLERPNVFRPELPSSVRSQYANNSMGQPMGNGVGAGQARELEARVMETAEADGKPIVIVEAEGTEAAKEMHSSEPQALFEMEHVNRGIGTQKRIQKRLGHGRREEDGNR